MSRTKKSKTKFEQMEPLRQNYYARIIHTDLYTRFNCKGSIYGENTDGEIWFIWQILLNSMQPDNVQQREQNGWI